MYTINPKNYGLNTKGRLMYYDLRQKKYFKKQIVEPGETIEISNRVILQNILNFKFKFQKYEKDTWVDVSKFFFLENARNIKTFLVDESNMNKDEIIRTISIFAEDKNNLNYSLAVLTFKKTVIHISNTDLEKVENIKKYLEIASSYFNEMTPLWKNINVYLDFILRRKTYFTKENLMKKSYDELAHIFKTNVEHRNFIHNEIQELNKYDLETSYILKGLYYSFLKERKSATREFKSAIEGDTKLILDMGIGEGIFTYIDNVNNDGKYYNEIIDLNSVDETSEFTVLMSLDPTFMRKYGPQLFYSIISLKKQHFHFHLVGEPDEIHEIFTESINLFNTMKTYIKPSQSVIEPTFSYETCPDYVKDPITLYACARFLNAPRFMEKFDSKILIIDADYYINNGFEKYFAKLKETDISMAVSGGVKSMRPWGRYMAGSVYVDRNEIGQLFLKELNSYIIENLRSEHTWTLDQNALTYAMESVENKRSAMNFGNAYKFPRPLVQPSIRRFVEN